MECNKEEAVRAKGIAEQKMQNGDFEGAKKFALKAQKLFPELENISQLLTVCNVHCCAKCKLYGSEMDWYGILQIEQSADEISIKKQYRKLALLLHPDKNKFAGAEAAFKLIGEANRILTDQMRRSQYDMKCRISARTAPKPTTHQSNRASSFNSQYGSTNNYQNGSSKFTASYSYQQAQHLTFWTFCSACGIKYQYYKDFVNRLLHCPTCGTSFIARDLGPQGLSRGYPGNQFSNQKEVPNQGPCKVSSQCNGGKPSGVHFPHGYAGSDPISKARSSVPVGDSKKQEKVGVQMHQPYKGFSAEQKVDGFSNVRDGKKGVEIPKPNAAKTKGSGTSRNAKKKRGRKSIEETDESCETGHGNEVEDMVSHADCVNNTGMNSKVNRGHRPRRSSREKRHVSYEEKLSDDDDFVSSSHKRSKVTTPPNANDEKVDDSLSKKDNSVDPTAAVDVCQKEVKQKASAPPEGTIPNKKHKTGESEGKEEEPVIFENKNEVSQVDGGSGSSKNVNPCPQVLEYPDPEFSDFEKHRAENCFAVNQVWAIYDTLDGMPRFYARVKKVFTPGFKLRITWLEPNPDEENQQNWVDLDLPVSCGKYCNGSSEGCVDRLMFSHRIDPIKSFGKCSFLVYPQKGETWALYRDWDVKWASEPEKHKPPYQYDFVEVLTDFDEEIGIGVAHLGKVKGFVSIFRQTERDGVISFQVSPRELYRFSHRIPSCRMTGKEREGVPVGSFELDPASLPTKLDEPVDPGDMKLGNHYQDNEANCSCPKFPQNQAKATIDSEENLTPMKNDKSDIEREASPFRRSTRASSRMLKGHGKEDDSIKDIRDCNFTQPKESCTSGDTGDQKINTPNECKKNDLDTDCLKPRRSPRDLRKKVSQVKDAVKDICDSNFNQLKESCTSGDTGDQKINTPNKCKKNDLTTDCLKPRTSARDLSRKGSQEDDSVRDMRDFKLTQPKETCTSGDTGDRKINTPNKCKKNDLTTDFLKSRRLPRDLNRRGSQEDDSVRDIHDSNFTQPKESSTSGDTGDQKVNTPNKCKKNDLTTDCLKPRRSPRDLSRKGSQVSNTQGSASFSPPFGDVHLSERDGSTVGITKSSSVSTRVSSAHRTSKSECYNFKREKFEDKFEVDQIWALYNRDGMPEDYAQVKKIESTPDFRLHVTLLEMCSRPKDLELPPSCGIFKVKSGQTKVVSCDVVSHRLRAEPIGKNRYKIYTTKEEV
ncbi:uncharacterized protein LOC110415816 [Herrania umbratica]|uniref:Uncharacterized protein LOC110415816 n=1 Tax=Herrania umbratica TaxID=108875 RepID=A0A6J1A7V5_9ROSI|nr:uncharacterized protein LOC110415816 [Herrania umbratica]